MPFLRADHDRAARNERLQIGLGGGGGEHPAVHRRRDHQRAVRGERGERQQVIGQAERHFCDRVGGDRRDQEQIRRTGEVHMQHVRFGAPQFGIGVRGKAGDRLKGERADEPRRGFGEQHVHVGARLGELARQVDRLVGRDGTGYSQQDAFAIEWVHWFIS